MATGVLPLLLGKATRAANYLQDTDKEYNAEFKLGYCTDTQDSTGKTLNKSDIKVTGEQIEDILTDFRGNILQTPPMYSAVQINGQRLYTLARKGIEVEREKRPVTVYKLLLNKFDENTQSGELTIRCSKGTYIRTICADIGEKLGCFGVMTSLRRTFAAGFSLTDAVTLKEAEELSDKDILKDRVYPTENLFSAFGAVKVSPAQSTRFKNGGGLSLERVSALPKNIFDGMIFRVKSSQDEFLGLGTVDFEKAELKVLRLFCD